MPYWPALQRIIVKNGIDSWHVGNALASLTLCTFNVENLFLRYKIFGYLPGGRFKRRILTNRELVEEGGFLPSQKWKNSFKIFDKDAWRLLTGKAIKGQGSLPDILCVQEVENMQALRRFNDDFLDGYYDNIMVIDGHDPRLIDVGILTKSPFKIRDIVSHMDEKDDKGEYIFSRDCLESTLDVGNGKHVRIFINHLKSKYAETPEEKKKADLRRLKQAERVAQIIKERFPGSAFNDEPFAVVGDFNDTPDSPYLKPLVKDLGLENVIMRIHNERERWTHWWDTPNVVGQLDYILLSPSLSRNSTGQPYIERRGISKRREVSYLDAGDGRKGEEVDFTFNRFPGVTKKIEASDHCPVLFKLQL